MTNTKPTPRDPIQILRDGIAQAHRFNAPEGMIYRLMTALEEAVMTTNQQPKNHD